MRGLDLCCKAGGASRGYALAGIEMVGVDIELQRHYPYEFHQGDALTFPLDGYDFYHASPPCQEYTPLHARHPEKHYPDIIAPLRARLQATGKPWVIENVVTAPLDYWVQLCGAMFDLRVYRHRRFETSWYIWQPAHPKHTVGTGAGRGQTHRKAHYLAGGNVIVTGNVGTYCGPGMGIDWMNGAELSQAIPPAYTEWIGRQLLMAQ